MSKRVSPIEKAIADVNAEICLLELVKERLLRRLPVGAMQAHGVTPNARDRRPGKRNNGNAADGPALVAHEQVQG